MGSHPGRGTKKEIIKQGQKERETRTVVCFRCHQRIPISEREKNVTQTHRGSSCIEQLFFQDHWGPSLSFAGTTDWNQGRYKASQLGRSSYVARICVELSWSLLSVTGRHP